eukprot:365652-Chlamydomonas_euryale.AAC.5
MVGLPSSFNSRQDVQLESNRGFHTCIAHAGLKAALPLLDLFGDAPLNRQAYSTLVAGAPLQSSPQAACAGGCMHLHAGYMGCRLHAPLCRLHAPASRLQASSTSAGGVAWSAAHLAVVVVAEEGRAGSVVRVQTAPVRENDGVVVDLLGHPASALSGAWGAE